MPDPVITPDPALTTPVVTPPAVTGQWFEAFDPETKGYLTNRGWDKKTPAEAFLEAANAHRGAEKLIGAPAAEVLRMPKAGAPEAEVKAFWSKLGTPLEKTGYDFADVKMADGTPVDPKLLDTVRETAAAVNAPKAMADAFAKAVVKIKTDEAAEAAAIHTTKLAEEKATLVKNWGANFEANKFVASQGAAKLGMKPEEVTALEGVVGYSRIMEMMRQVGALAGEARFVNNPADGGNLNGVMSKDQARARVSELKADTAWTNRYLAGGSAEKREMLALNTIISS